MAGSAKNTSYGNMGVEEDLHSIIAKLSGEVQESRLHLKMAAEQRDELQNTCNNLVIAVSKQQRMIDFMKSEHDERERVQTAKFNDFVQRLVQIEQTVGNLEHTMYEMKSTMEMEAVLHSQSRRSISTQVEIAPPTAPPPLDSNREDLQYATAKVEEKLVHLEHTVSSMATEQQKLVIRQQRVACKEDHLEVQLSSLRSQIQSILKFVTTERNVTQKG